VISQKSLQAFFLILYTDTGREIETHITSLVQVTENLHNKQTCFTHVDKQ